ncbi:MAG: Nif3-like dinuclear metal center hexameric protein [Bacteroidales bacterium]|nr:Nif3-like dinuclear metal center hexameric protein [Bacteroidales bacterium]
MKIKDITNYLETLAPLSFQEPYDNAGLITGNKNNDLKGVIITLDTVEDVVEEAIKKEANLIISHHPIIFKGLKKITGKNYVERTIIKAIKNDIAIYAVHTNLDNVNSGVNAMLCKKLNLKNYKILRPVNNHLRKLITFVPEEHAEKVRTEIFNAGAGHIGNYDNCSFNSSGQGTFRAGDNTNPFVGKKNKIHFENEIKIETIYPKHLENQILNALFLSHPYEEVAYDLYSLENKYNNAGAGMIGELSKPEDALSFLKRIKTTLNTGTVKHTKLTGNKIKKVALCGGSGSFLLKDAIAEKADIFISGDFKYHEFFDTENKIIIADAGHYETEQFTKELIFDVLVKKFNNFACFLSEINTNPINYL